MPETITVASAPCGSCPYRRDVPSGIWAEVEYDKLPAYDNETWAQPSALFLCHQRDGTLCAGWLACHDPHELLALRFARDVDPAVFEYETNVPVFSSGAEARAHGVREIDRLGSGAARLIGKLQRLRKKKGEAL